MTSTLITSGLVGTVLQHPWSWLISALLGGFIICIFKRRYLSPLSGIPGPLLASVSQLWMAKESYGDSFHRTNIALHEKYGKLVRIGPNEVSVADLGLVRKMFAAGNKYAKSSYYDSWKGKRKFDLFGERDEKAHSSMRRLVSRVYSMDSMRDLEVYAERTVNKFVTRLDEMQGQTLDMSVWFQLFAFDTIGELTFSHPYGFLDTGKDDGTLASVCQALWSLSWTSFAQWIIPLDDFVTPIFGPQLSMHMRNGKFAQFAMRELREREKRPDNHKDMLTKLFEARKDKPDLNDAAIQGIMNSNVFAGSDTTAIALRGVFYNILKHPQVKEKFLNELWQRRSSGELSEPIKFHETEKWPYLQALIYEALRLHPVTGMGFSRIVPQPGVEVDGHFLPAGTAVAPNAWVIHRNKEVYGDDVEVYRPERWLDESKKSDMQRFFLAFGGGTRTCIGRNISWMEISKIIPTLFLNFDFALVRPDRPLKEVCAGLVVQEGLLVTYKRQTRAFE
ncbi:Cytochrome p450 family protein [Penicillium odoratum]|uniref:Cytochrome p450 family protein n=1 Tax=Penicillium odoratum TaxID=1167516 RepID=UPI0025492BB6|nr:Cytochrome p450 family protein [Penicillium odoratum]KAJ5776871.1 Cytochrome p450 family protein [Penicillium odoratum]